MKVQPLGDRVLVKPTEEQEQTKGGIFIPDTASKERPQEGEIIAVGEGRTSEEGEIVDMKVEVGDKILFEKYGGTEIEIEGDKLLIMSEVRILAIVKE
jgi:chaperonin GroES